MKLQVYQPTPNDPERRFRRLDWILSPLAVAVGTTAALHAVSPSWPYAVAFVVGGGLLTIGAFQAGRLRERAAGSRELVRAGLVIVEEEKLRAVLAAHGLRPVEDGEERRLLH